MKIYKTLIIVLVLAAPFEKSFSQNSLADIPKNQRNTLDIAIMFSEERIAKESDIDDEYLSELRSSYGEGFMPYYAEGDFNSDGKTDFAIVSVTTGGVKDKEATSYPDRYNDWAVTILIFEANKEYKKGFDPNGGVSWDGEKKEALKLLSNLHINYENFLYYCIDGLSCERAISVGSSYQWENFNR